MSSAYRWLVTLNLEMIEGTSIKREKERTKYGALGDTEREKNRLQKNLF